jgi:hypothetical protein
MNLEAETLGVGAAKAGAGAVDAAILFSAHMWRKNGTPGSAGVSGPGSDADEVLFHEMIHSLRFMAGVANQAKLNNDYDNDEEFLAVTLTNIYSAETGRKLRGSHHGFPLMPQPRDFLKNPLSKHLLRHFKDAQPKFYDELAAIPAGKAWWNPVRELKDAGVERVSFIGPASCKRNRDRPHRVGLRSCNARDCRECGSARYHAHEFGPYNEA